MDAVEAEDLRAGERQQHRRMGGALSSSASTAHMTGGLRIDAPDSSGRSRYDCTMAMSIRLGGEGTRALATVTWSGTITWEMPLGTVTVHSCGT